MTLRHRIFLYINKLKFKKRVVDTVKKERSINEKKTFYDFLEFRKQQLQRLVSESFSFTDNERLEKRIYQAKLDEIESIIEQYKEYVAEK